MREGSRVTVMGFCLLLAAGGCHPPSAPTGPQAGLAGPAERPAFARREALVGGGSVELERSGSELVVRIAGPARGFPSVCVGNRERIEILHASAALGTVIYSPEGSSWRLQQPFTWSLREAGPAGPPSESDRERFFTEHGWLSTASQSGAPARELRIALTPGREFLAVTFLSTETMLVAYWPASVDDACRSLALVSGDAPQSAEFDPGQWFRLP